MDQLRSRSIFTGVHAYDLESVLFTSGISKMFLMTISLCQFYEANQGVIKGTHTMQQLVLFAVHLHLLFSIGLFLRSYI